MLRAKCALWLLFGMVAACAPGLGATTGNSRTSLPPTRQQLLGTWRLVAIVYSGPGGETRDPFYQANSTGTIMYDNSGWMSVHIAAPNRPVLEVPQVRVPPAGADELQRKAQAFDTYYAYFGTWTYDRRASKVLHHVVGSLIPAETGMNYAQAVTIDGGRLVFTVRSGSPGTETVRKKVWEKMPTQRGAVVPTMNGS